MSFSELGLRAELLRAVADQGYTTPTPVQKQAIPAILAARDVLAGAQTGTGKTAGFTLPLLQRLAEKPAPEGKHRRPVRTLILTPTRELAAQIHESVREYGKYLSLKSTVVFGGVGINPQIDALARGVDILIATPGRLLDLIGQRTVDLSQLEILVLDEADRMLDMGFIRDIRRILALLPPKGKDGRQNLLFSATYSDEIRELASGLLHDPVLIDVAPRNATVDAVNQVVHPVDRVRKRELLSFLIGSNNWRQVLVFTRTKHGANRLAEQLIEDGITAAAIHGNKSQGARTKALADFKAGSVRVLVATDIAARGLDIDGLPHVVNYELPNVPEDYVHRIGRTARAGNTGEAMSLVCIDERDFLRDIKRLIKRDIPEVVVEGYTPDPSIPAEPVFKERQQRQGRRGGGGGQPQRSQGNAPARSGGAPARSGQPSRNGGGQPSRGGQPARSGQSPSRGGQGRPQQQRVGLPAAPAAWQTEQQAQRQEHLRRMGLEAEAAGAAPPRQGQGQPRRDERPRGGQPQRQGQPARPEGGGSQWETVRSTKPFGGIGRR